MQTLINTARSWLLAPVMLSVLAGCSSDTDYDFEASQLRATEAAATSRPTEALFDPSSGIVPFPNNLLFGGNQDGTINIPVLAAQNAPSNPQVALNQQDGFSTTSPIVTPISKALDNESLVLGDTVRVFEVVTPMQPAEARAAVAVQAGATEIDPQQMVVTATDSQLILLPTVPLKPSTSYLIVLTNGIKSSNGKNLESSISYNVLKGDDVILDEAGEVDAQAEGLRGIINSHMVLVESQDNISSDDVVLSWVFTTQSVREVLQSVKDISRASTLVLGNAGINTSQATNGAAAGIADVYFGALDLPYYLTAQSDDVSPLDILNSYWKTAEGNVPGTFGDDGSTRDYTPVSPNATDVRVPVMMTLPNAASGQTIPDNGWPVTVFVHGITRNRTDMLAVADALAQAGRAVIAIDIPLHGVVDDQILLHASNYPLAPTERTFELDLVTIDSNTELQSSGSDGFTDPSGTHFFNLANLANARDNMRQAIADLFALTASLPTARVNEQDDVLNANNLTFVGHSLGGILGATMLSYDNNYQAATLAMPGGGIAQLLRASDRFGPVINAGLASTGVTPGSAQYEQFFIAAQTMLDSADPINHASTLANESTRIHMIEVIGETTVPNAVQGAPLSGTDPLIRMLQLPTVSQTVADSNGVVKFTAGDHGSLLRPVPVPEGSTPDLAPTVEMQTQMAGFAASQGTVLPVTDTSVVQQP